MARTRVHFTKRRDSCKEDSKMPRSLKMWCRRHKSKEHRDTKGGRSYIAILSVLVNKGDIKSECLTRFQNG